MIIAGDDEVIMGNGGENKKFSIATSAKAFKILSSGLYKNKIRAVVRELACNCTDAHFLNGFKGAFDIKVPSQIDPRFVIRDYGPGLSKENVENLYTTYFASTKNGSNDFIGALGLGSKSPFSYTETFTVTSYHDGVVRGYTAMLDKGEPVIRMIFEEPMTENDKTGIEIVVPVKTSDLDRWRSEISYVIRPFGKDKVNIQGSNAEQHFFPEFEEYLAASKPEYGYYENDGLHAVYGNIVYPLNNIPGMKDLWLMAKNRVVYIKFPLGELDIAASREELSLDETTIKNILSRVENLDKRVMEEDIKEWSESDNTRKVFREVNSLNSKANKMIHQRQTKFTSKNLNLVQLNNMYTIPNDWIYAGVTYTVCNDPKLKRIKKNNSNSSITNLNSLFGIHNEEITIIIDDNKKKRLDAIRALASINYDTKNEESIKILKNNPWLPKNQSTLLFVNPESELEMNMLPDILKLFEGDKVNMYYTSELFAAVERKVVKIQREYEPRPKSASCTRFYIKDGDWLTEELFMTASEAEEISGYVVFSHSNSYHFMDKDKGFVNSMTSNMFCQIAKQIGVTEIHAVRPSLHKKILKLGQCDCLLETIYDTFNVLAKQVPEQYYSYGGSSSIKYTRHTSKHPELNFIESMFNEAGETTKESAMLFSFYSWLRSTYFHGYTDDSASKQFIKAQEIVQKNQSKAESKSIEKIKKFENENIVVSKYLRDHYDISKESVKEIVKLLSKE
ncbi:RIIA lysis inhibitor [Pectobacterium bacteriophage PM2]|uniref:Protector from prophage-induced early lysis n=1 Tax=Pectobacterium bacteriophage PM2 TaxID=1429794 RepID=A0A0A0Q0F4_9CAUD|nr:RIIA lysis inhibitor [Pectobacterium bacteriophage PM2]AHY24963.1 protector from prophage-induced early lysis [Pectobacterium bacteriophage PM2]